MAQETADGLARERTKGRRALASHLKRRRLIEDEPTVDQAYLGSTRLLAESRARWVVLNLEDAWGETRPQNVPGTDETQHANWTRRAKYGLGEFDHLRDITSITSMMHRVRGEGKETQDAGRP